MVPGIVILSPQHIQQRAGSDYDMPGILMLLDLTLKIMSIPWQWREIAATDNFGKE